MTKVMISKKSVMGVKEFMFNYLGITTDKDKVSHEDMLEILTDKGINIPKRANFNYISKESILSGTHVAVIDKNKKILIYDNPRYRSLKELLWELQSRANIERSKRERRRLLKEVGFIETLDGVFKEELEEFEITENVNRQKQFVKRGSHLIRKRKY